MRATDHTGRQPSATARHSRLETCSPTRPVGRTALPALCFTEITSWGVLYYAFPVLAPQISQDTGWSSTAVAAAFSGALLVSALVGIPLGRRLDNRGPRVIMITGSLLATSAVLGIAVAPTLTWFAAAWFIAGLAMAAVLYPPAFAAVTGWFDGTARTRALTTVTLVAGLASTVFAPLTAVLAQHFSWRTTYLVLAVVLASVTVPLHVLCLRGPWPAAPRPKEPDVSRVPRSAARSGPFLLLAASLTLASFSFAAAVVTLVPLLMSRGMTPSVAAWALGLGGVGQVLGRLGYGALIRRTGVRGRTVLVFLLAGITTLALGMIPGPVAAIVGASVVAGAVRGVATLLQATAVSDRWGAASYGALSAILGAPAVAAAALAPWAGAGLAAVMGGYPALFVLLAGLLGAAALLAAATSPCPRAESCV